MSTHYDTATPYIASYVILRQDGKIAFVLRQNTSWMSGYYSLPAGKVEPNESFINCAIREAKEEVGVTIEANDLQHILTGHRHDPDSTWVDICFEANEWKGEPHNAEPEIHGELAWFSPDSLPDNIVPNVRYYIEEIQAGHNYAEFGWEGVE